MFDSENVEIIVTSIYPQEGVVSFGVLDVATMAESIKEKQDKSRQIEAGKDSLTIQLTGGNGELLMLPVAYDSSYVVTNNGEKIDCHSAIDDALMLIPLSDGENNITVKFRPAGLTLGIILSLIGIVMLVVVAYFKDAIINNSVIKNSAFVMLSICEIALIAYLYIWPIFMTFLINVTALF